MITRSIIHLVMEKMACLQTLSSLYSEYVNLAKLTRLHCTLMKRNHFVDINLHGQLDRGNSKLMHSYIANKQAIPADRSAEEVQWRDD